MARREWDNRESGAVQKGTGKGSKKGRGKGGAENGGDRQIGR